LPAGRKLTREACYKAGVAREFSAGGVVVRSEEGQWWLAAIRPAGKPEGVWALPKGQIAAGDSPADTAVREVAEETGLHGRLDGKLGDVRYVYTWKGERIFKVVSFFLVRYEEGKLGEIPEAFRHEVEEVRWLPLADAPRLLAYQGERRMAEKAIAVLAGDEQI
jgi:8-oxo-dGTP pyrophosphatase MutT (NUDIX family)